MRVRPKPKIRPRPDRVALRGTERESGTERLKRRVRGLSVAEYAVLMDMAAAGTLAAFLNDNC